MRAPTANQVLNVARAELGTGEHPPGSNRTKYGAWYGMDPAYWCDIFVSWVAAHSGAVGIIGRCAFTPAHAAWFQAIGRWGNTPKPGALAFYDFPDEVHRIQHVGIVERVLPKGIIQTIEGNTSSGERGSQSNGDGVYRRRRSTVYVVGYGYPAYSPPGRVTPRPPASRSRRTSLLVDGVWGRKTTLALQQALHIPATGVIDARTRKALQTHIHVTVDGAWGPRTRRELQHRLGVPVDGVWGRQTIRRLQRKLNAGAF